MYGYEWIIGSALGGAGGAPGDHDLGGFVFNAQSTSVLATSPAAGTMVDLVTVNSPGLFVSAGMTKDGGTDDITALEVVLDGTVVVGDTVAALRNWNVTEDDGFGSVLLSSGFGSVSTVTVGYPVPLVFRDTLVLRANIGANDTGINQITAETLHGTHLALSCC